MSEDGGRKNEKNAALIEFSLFANEDFQVLIENLKQTSSRTTGEGGDDDARHTRNYLCNEISILVRGERRPMENLNSFRRYLCASTTRCIVVQTSVRERKQNKPGR